MKDKDNTPKKYEGDKSSASSTTTGSQDKPKKKAFWKRHFMSLFLLLLLIVSVAWGFIANRSTVSSYEKEITELNADHEERIKALRKEKLEQFVSTLALAVRSEMIADNLNQVNQYFVQTLKNVDVQRILLVNQNTGQAILSTNKKDEETVFDKKELVQTKSAITKDIDGSIYAATPIMGLNTQLGVLIVQVD